MQKRVKLIVLAIVSVLLSVGIACSARDSALAGAENSLSAAPTTSVVQVKIPEKITLHEGKKPGSINFPHKAHTEIAEKAGKGCVTCHHTSTNAKLKTEKPAKCETCHMEKGNAKNPKAGAKEMWSQEAFHTKCQGCHKEQKKGPVKCMECHTKAT